MVWFRLNRFGLIQAKPVKQLNGWYVYTTISLVGSLGLQVARFVVKKQIGATFGDSSIYFLALSFISGSCFFLFLFKGLKQIWREAMELLWKVISVRKTEALSRKEGKDHIVFSFISCPTIGTIQIYIHGKT